MKKYAVTLRGHYEKTISVYADSPEEAKKKTKSSFSIPTLSTLPMMILSAAKPILPSVWRTAVKKMRTRTAVLKRRTVRTVLITVPCAENVCMRTIVKIKSYQALNLVIQTAVWKQIRLLGDAPNTPI